MTAQDYPTACTDGRDNVEKNLKVALGRLLEDEQATNNSGISQKEPYAEELWYAKIHSLNAKNPDPKAKLHAGTRRPLPIPKQGTPEWGIMTKLDRFRAQCIDNWRTEIIFWRATSFDPEDIMTTASQDVEEATHCRLFIFRDNHDPLSEYFLVPIRYSTTQGDKCKDTIVSIRVDGQWISLETWLNRFIHKIPEEEVTSTLQHSFQWFAATFGGKQLCFFRSAC